MDKVKIQNIYRILFTSICFVFGICYFSLIFIIMYGLMKHIRFNLFEQIHF